MTWVVRTYKTRNRSAFNDKEEPEDNYFDTKSDAEEYRKTLKRYSEIFETTL